MAGDLSHHPRPGNIRELENVIHHALLVSKGRVIRPEDLNLAIRRHAETVEAG